MQLIDERVETFKVFAQRFRHFFVGREPAKLLAELRVSFLQILALLAKGSRRPIQVPKAIENRASDADFGIGLELNVSLRLKLINCIEQANDAGVNEVAHFDVVRQSRGYTMGNVLDERKRLGY